MRNNLAANNLAANNLAANNLAPSNLSRHSPALSMTDQSHQQSGGWSVCLLVIAQICAMSVWFSAAAVIPALSSAYGLDISALAILPTATQLGFVCGALFFAISGLSDRFDPRHIFAMSALLAALLNLWLLISIPLAASAIISRFLVGLCLAGVYPVGLKMVMGWSRRHRALLASLLVAALTIGSALPQLVLFLEGSPLDEAGRNPSNWRAVLAATSLLALLGAVLMGGVRLGPHHAQSSRFSAADLLFALKNRAIRRAYFGYFGHMWELYAFWAWASAALIAAGIADPGPGSGQGIQPGQGADWAAGVIFVAMAGGALACIPFGRLADRYGKEIIAGLLLAGSGLAAIASIVAYLYASPWLIVAIIIWGIFIIPDSPLFSAMIGDHAEAEQLGSLVTLQTAIGFGLTVISVQLTPIIASHLGWGWAFLFLVPGPILGLLALGIYRWR